MMNRDATLDALVSKSWDRAAFNCWIFVRTVRRDLFGCEALPFFDVDLVDDLPRRLETFASHPARRAWSEVFDPQDGDIVIMTRAGLLHAGIYLVTDRRGRVWHCDEPHGVIFETLTELKELRRWKPRFFRHHP